MKRFFTLTLCLIIPLFSLSGCSDYLGLDEMSIVAGMAIDLSEDENSAYVVTVEVVQNGSYSKDPKVNSELLSVKGKTLFSAIFGINERLRESAYFSNMGVIILSHKAAENGGLAEMLDALMRHFSIRDSVAMIIAKTDTAREILEIKDSDEMITSFTIQDVIEKKRLGTESIPVVPLYQIYTFLSTGVPALCLPVFNLEPASGQETKSGEGSPRGEQVEKQSGGEKDKKSEDESKGGEAKKPDAAGGEGKGGEQKSSAGEGGGDEKKLFYLESLAVFQGDKLTAYYDVEYLSEYFILTKKLESGVFTFHYDGGKNGKTTEDKTGELSKTPDNITLEIENGKPKMGFSFDGESFTLTSDIKLVCSLKENSAATPFLTRQQLNELEIAANEQLSEQLKEAIQYTQQETSQDIFGFSENIYQHDPKLWESVSDKWVELYKNAKLDIRCNVSIESTGTIQDSYSYSRNASEGGKP